MARFPATASRLGIGARAPAVSAGLVRRDPGRARHRRARCRRAGACRGHPQICLPEGQCLPHHHHIAPLPRARPHGLAPLWHPQARSGQAPGIDRPLVRGLRLGKPIENPMFIGLFCDFRHRTGRMPQSTQAAFEGFVMERLARDRQRLETLGIALDDLREGAEQIAFSMSGATDLGLARSPGIGCAARCGRDRATRRCTGRRRRDSRL
jgi:hypothetical protein